MKNIFGEEPTSQETVESFGVSWRQQKSNKSAKSATSFTTVAASDAAEEFVEARYTKERKIFKKDASEMFKKMAAVIDLPDETPQHGPSPTLKD